MKKSITKILAIIGAITAAAALIFLFRDKLLKLLEACKGKCCKKEDDTPCDLDDLEGAVEDAAEKVEEVSDDTAEAVKEAVADAEEKAAAIAEEFKDYADVEEEKPAE